ncbi:MAG: serine hydroxymethyltransferase [Candidatus Woesearchaeota archaeon]
MTGGINILKWVNSLFKKRDSAVFGLIEKEHDRQRNYLNMIPSENYCPRQVREASASVLMNKYSEGYPNKRYYQGNEFIDKIETLAIQRAKKLFNAEHANVQPWSGSIANMAVYHALLEPGDKLMAMNLSHGGHLTHGSPVNFSGAFYKIADYGVDKDTEMLDMDKVRKLAEKEKPKMILSGFTSYPRTIDFKEFHDIAHSVGAVSFADISHIAGLIVGKVHPSPLPYTDIVMTTTHKTLQGPRGAIILTNNKFAGMIDKAVFPGLQGGPHENIIAAKAVCFDLAMKPEFQEYAFQIVKNAKALASTLMENGIKLVSNGTDNHLLLIDLLKTKNIEKQGLGRQGAMALEQSGIVTNANTIPFDPSTPFNPSGIRIGTPILTMRGMKESEMKVIGNYISKILLNMPDDGLKERIRKEVLELCEEFPLR